jgi:hypothetical protein
MEKRKLFVEAQNLIFAKLDAKYPNPITIQDTEFGFYENDISEKRDLRAPIMDDAFTYLKEEGLIEFSSPNGRMPRVDLKLTVKGLNRPRNPVEKYKEEGIKAGIGAALNTLAKAILNKYTS